MIESVKVRKSPEDLPRVIGRGLCDLSSRGIRWGLSVLDCVFRTGCPGLCVLRFVYLASLTRRTTVTIVGTGLPNHSLHQAYWFYFLNSFISSYLCCVLVHICVWRLWLKTFSISSAQFLQSVCLQPAYPVFTLSVLCVHLSFHHDDYAIALWCLYLSTYSAASCSWLRNFLTLKILSDEFVKIAYSPPPSNQLNALSIGTEQGTPLFCVILV